MGLNAKGCVAEIVAVREDASGAMVAAITGAVVVAEGVLRPHEWHVAPTPCALAGARAETVKRRNLRKRLNCRRHDRGARSTARAEASPQCVATLGCYRRPRRCAGGQATLETVAIQDAVPKRGIERIHAVVSTGSEDVLRRCLVRVRRSAVGIAAVQAAVRVSRHISGNAADQDHDREGDGDRVENAHRACLRWPPGKIKRSPASQTPSPRKKDHAR